MSTGATIAGGLVGALVGLVAGTVIGAGDEDAKSLEAYRQALVDRGYRGAKSWSRTDLQLEMIDARRTWQGALATIGALVGAAAGSALSGCPTSSPASPS